MKKRSGEKRLFSLRWFGILIGLSIIVWIVWFFFFSYVECDSWACFNNHLEDCDRAKFIGGTDMIFEYVILGESDGECAVSVELLQGELGNQDFKELEGLEMICYLPEGVVMIPESNIGNCHGLLKEGLQELVIRKLHTYLVQNLGRINLEMLGVPDVEGY